MHFLPIILISLSFYTSRRSKLTIFSDQLAKTPIDYSTLPKIIRAAMRDSLKS
ncbi:hypothetical protein ACI0FR_02110 [Paenochrobactrum sp. BZR 201-1]